MLDNAARPSGALVCTNPQGLGDEQFDRLKFLFPEGAMPDLAQPFVERGDLAHLALFLWASGASGLLMWTLRELAAANRRFDEFVRELQRFNRRFGEH